MLVSLVGLSLLTACTQEPVALGNYDYPDDAVRSCSSEKYANLAGQFDDERASNGIRYSLRTPANYDPAIAHRLLLVYAAATHNRHASEKFTQFSLAATSAGFIVAYADHYRLSLPNLNKLALLPKSIGEKWCIDQAQVFLSGHSDGGTAASAMAFRSDDGLQPRAIAASAAGVNESHLRSNACPSTLPVMILHNEGDELFPGFGRSHASWWAACHGCDANGGEIEAGSCLGFTNCSSPVRYCKATGGHRRWPQNNAEILRFFLEN